MTLRASAVAAACAVAVAALVVGALFWQGSTGAPERRALRVAGSARSVPTTLAFRMTATSTAPGPSARSVCQTGAAALTTAAVAGVPGLVVLSPPSAESSMSARAGSGACALEIGRFLGRPVHAVRTRRREVALTIDDGPSSRTRAIVEVLEERHAYATFFFCGRTLRGPGVRYAASAASAGNEVGNHTLHHVELTRLSAAKMAEEISSTSRRLVRATGYKPRFVRPCAGAYDTAALKALAKDRLVLALWSVNANDADGNATAESIVRTATSGIGPGSIILLHETNPDTLKALPEILDVLERKGLKPVTYSRLLSGATSFY